MRAQKPSPPPPPPPRLPKNTHGCGAAVVRAVRWAQRGKPPKCQIRMHGGATRTVLQVGGQANGIRYCLGWDKSREAALQPSGTVFAPRTARCLWDKPAIPYTVSLTSYLQLAPGQKAGVVGFGLSRGSPGSRWPQGGNGLRWHAVFPLWQLDAGEAQRGQAQRGEDQRTRP
jgi:hypothetical protein